MLPAAASSASRPGPQAALAPSATGQPGLRCRPAPLRRSGGDLGAVGSVVERDRTSVRASPTRWMWKS